MTEEEIKLLKEELRKEIKEEIALSIESNRNTSIWHDYIKSYIEPILEKKVTEPRIKYQIQNSINTFARVLAKKNHVYKITELDLEMIKPKIEQLISVL